MEGRTIVLSYMSPTSLYLFENDIDQFYLTYIRRLKRSPQLPVMAVGSSFDAFVKAYIHNFYNPKESIFEELFNKQVDEDNRPAAMKIGRVCFNVYKESGCLMGLIRKFSGMPKMEFKTNVDIDGVPVMGIPDLFFQHPMEHTKDHEKSGVQGILDVVVDWKVNGLLSSASAAQGYISCDMKPHKKAILSLIGDFYYDAASTLQESKPDWCTQLYTYSLACGNPNALICVDQIFKRVNGSISVAQHRLFLTDTFKENVRRRYRHAWDVIQSDHFFRDLPSADSKAKCKLLSNRKEKKERY